MKTAWNIIKSPSSMALTALISLALAIYFGVFYEKKGEISITVSPPAKVLDIHKSVGGLEVSYDGQNLKETNKTLWAITTTIKNTGNAGIKKGDFDRDYLLGVNLKNGKIVDSPTIQANSEYLQNSIKITKSNNSIQISPAIIDVGDSISLNFLVLGSETDNPELFATGKLSGVLGPNIYNVEDEQKFSIVNSITHAETWWIHPLRIIFYMFFIALCMALITIVIAVLIVPITSIKDKKDKILLQKKIDNFRPNENLTKEARALSRFYLERKHYGLAELSLALVQISHRLDLVDELSPQISTERAKAIALMCYPINKHQRAILKDLIENDLSDEMQRDDLLKWSNEINALAKYLDHIIFIPESTNSSRTPIHLGEAPPS